MATGLDNVLAAIMPPTLKSTTGASLIAALLQKLQSNNMDMIRANTANGSSIMLNGAGSSYKGDDTTHIQTQIIFAHQALAAAKERDAQPLPGLRRAESQEADTAVLPSLNFTDSYGKLFKIYGDTIELCYGTLGNAAKRVGRVGRTYARSRQELNVQKLSFEQVNAALIRVIQRSSKAFAQPPWAEVLDVSFWMISERLQKLSEALERLHGQHLVDRNTGLKAGNLDHPRLNAEAIFLKELELINKEHVEDFIKLAQPVIGIGHIVKGSAASTRAGELAQLSIEGRASAQLYHCLGQCCPIGHEHTAIMSLKPHEPRVRDGRSADKMTRHMAIEPTAGEQAGLIWLKVVSVMAREELSTPNTTPAAEEYVQVTATPAVTVEQAFARPAKRPRSSSPESSARQSPILKAAKFYAGELPASRPALAPVRPASPPRRPSDSASFVSSGWYSAVRDIRVCPACLSPYNDTSSWPIMQMTHGSDSTCEHYVYYLPSKQRPAELLSLPDVLDRLEKTRRRNHAATSKKWRVSVARLVAESVLRLDWRDARRRPDTHNLVFFLDVESQEFEPFLKIKIDSHEQLSSMGPLVQSGPSAKGVKDVVLNLGLILLQLDGQTPMWRRDWEQERYEEYLNKMSDYTDMGREYAQVIRNCAYLKVQTLGDKDPARVNEEQFQKDYFAKIVSPLKTLEENY